MINLSLSLTKSLSYTIIWVLFVIPSCVFSVDVHHKKCIPWFKCGKDTYLNYPFWTADREECGHPDFKVNCSGDFAEFNISSVKFQIIEMNYYDDVIRLARMDYRNNLCPQHPENATINQNVLPFPEDTELGTFYYNCSGPRADLPFNDYITKLECGPSYFVSSPSDGLRASCERIVNIPVSRSALKIEEKLQSLKTIETALDEGFKLNFNSVCSGCILSRGACGFNESSKAFVCYCGDGPHEHTCQDETEQKSPSITTTTKTKTGIGFACGFLGAILITGCLLCFIIRRKKKLAGQYTRKYLSTTTPYASDNTMSTTGCFLCFKVQKRGASHYPRDHNLKVLVQLKQYTYAEVKKITKSFSHTVGKGGFGTVYRGNLCDDRKVAVKILKDFKSSGEDFINEVVSMSQTSHVNIVSLLGFCYEGSKRAIVYEFLENGSLDQFLSTKNSLNLDVITLYRIALGVARGLEYLHHGCRTRIVHFDIKPQNVLLDESLCPKVSDFGLAKLCEKRESILSLLDARGTIGYIAPEVFSRMYGRVSHRSDVYSYGMLVLEMIGARNKETLETAPSNSSSAYFPDWIYQDLENGDHTWKFGDETTREEKEIIKKMILVGLWCIQPCPLNRPPMNRVVEMMEGSLDALEVPPKPSINFGAVPLLESSSLSEENSNYTEVLI
ncbi:LEAF RUST 10 DISEASE-RESISTANCE LOCUS RECEPTOR-LIKE PROTEIN KINASE-like 2.1 [Cardamine amara subsp. amara]|uniref:non-specific serine/threonine protein kinase n=1 Tax=Cardamine amara subsp. amara TaxID=228776 RepID=A0ABD1BZ36_CARAN